MLNSGRVLSSHLETAIVKMALRGLFYSEFDNIAGPQIVFQAPPKCVFVSSVIC